MNLYMWGGSDSINRYIDEWNRAAVEEGVGCRLEAGADE